MSVSFLYMAGRTDFWYETNAGRMRRLVLTAGDLLVMRQASHAGDRGSRVLHGAGESGLRVFVTVSNEA
jgi:hypothetical protein